jgi:hypothetical protein
MLLRTGSEGRASYWSMQSLGGGGVCVSTMRAAAAATIDEQPLK